MTQIASYDAVRRKPKWQSTRSSTAPAVGVHNRYKRRDACAGTPRWSCNPETTGPAATSAPCCAGTRLPAVARSESAASSRTSTASVNLADHPREPPRHAQNLIPPYPACRQMRRLPGRHASEINSSSVTGNKVPCPPPFSLNERHENALAPARAFSIYLPLSH